MAAEEEPALLTLAECAALKGVSECSVRSWIKQGKLAAVRLKPSNWLRVRREDLDAMTSAVAAREPAAVAVAVAG